MNFSIKLRELNLNVCEEYKTEREARGLNRTERGTRRSNIILRSAKHDVRITHPRSAQICESSAK